MIIPRSNTRRNRKWSSCGCPSHDIRAHYHLVQSGHRCLVSRSTATVAWGRTRRQSSSGGNQYQQTGMAARLYSLSPYQRYFYFNLGHRILRKTWI
ncbi:hypothetical protein PoB_001919400 [Plakobranchus ocellatus]|uniref:Uncharacterized protein n=1 Tax=Plakobranchus ocellatus TaxID=259542 RepID=A0AAV3ZE67_9GAST|nr:hypothetical protein PoB_001919400 [Plakobranchus ocellatus]